ncbi:MAG: hypothetical protein ABJK28_09150 [Algibacter sp.]
MKNIRLSLILIAIVNALISNGQTYSTSFEEDIFRSYKKDSLNYNFFKSLSSIDSLAKNEIVSKYQDKVLSVLRSFPPKESKEKKEKKRIKYIYDELHQTFFKKYVLNSYFTDMFKDGTYNCVTATALYAFAFDELNIPYHIKETPSHVFLVAYPNTHKIYLETTVPGAYGFIVPKETEVKKVVDELISYKLVTKEEVLAKGYMKFYEDYYYGNEFINKRSLIGMQYYNKGLFCFQAIDYDRAINNLRKSKVFYSSPLIKPILKNIMFLKVNDLEFNSEDDVDFLLELLSFSIYPEDYSLASLKSSLFKIVDHDDNDNVFIETVIDKFKILKTERVRNEALEFLYEYLARNAATDENLDEALGYSDEIIKVNSKSKIAQNIIEYVCFRKVVISTFDLESLKSFERNCEKYPFLKENKRYNISLAHLYGSISLMNFKNKSIKEGTSYLKKLENVLDNTDVLKEVNKNLLSELYLKVGNYYYYKEQHKASYKIYKKGLVYVPKNSDLIKRAQWSKHEL